VRVDRVYRWLVPRVITPLGERVRHPRWTTARDLAERQWQTPDELERRAVSRLRALLDHASRHVPHYRDLFARALVAPPDVQRMADLARIPVSTKADLRAGFPDRTTADNVPAHRRQPMMTSGSTGRPFEFYWDRAALAGLGGTDWFWLHWAGTAPWHTRIVIASPAYFYDRVAPPRRWRRAFNQVVLGERTERLPADQPSTAGLHALVERVTTRGPYFIRGYPGALARLAARLADEGAAGKRPPGGGDIRGDADRRRRRSYPPRLPFSRRGLLLVLGGSADRPDLPGQFRDASH
jgi:phenylacetate-CoA ligase